MEHESSILYEPVNRLAQALGLRWEIPDHIIMAGLVVLLSAIIFPLASRSFRKENPGTFQQILEVIVQGLRGLLDEVVGHGAGQKYVSIIGGFAAFIFVSNLFGLIYFLQPPTGNPNTTFGLAVCAFLYYNWQGLRQQGLVHYLAHFVGPVWWLFPIMIPIEIISHLSRILSLGMRLFGNIFGEHTATGIFMGMLPFIVPWPMMGLGVFGALLQTFVFIMMTMVYIGGAVTAEEH